VLHNHRVIVAVAAQGFVEELESEIAEEACKFGEVAKITIFPASLEGVVMVKFQSAGAAAAAVDNFKQRFFGGKKMDCEYWDGTTKYGTTNAEGDEADRIDTFGQWLEGEESSE
jgi:hypothetical protein